MMPPPPPPPPRGKVWGPSTHAGDFAVDLGGVLALGVGVLGGAHLQHAHPEGVDIHRLVVALLVHLRRHELRGPWWGGRAKGPPSSVGQR